MDGKDFPGRLCNAFKVRVGHWQNDQKIKRMAEAVAQNAPQPSQAPIVFFNASTRLSGLSLNAGFSLVSAWSLQLQGVPVVHFICKAGLTHCVLGTNRQDLSKSPPCKECIRQSKTVYHNANQFWFDYRADQALQAKLVDLSLGELSSFVYQGVPLGKLCIASMRWILRRHNLVDDEITRQLYKEYICSGWSVKQQFEQLLNEHSPQSVVVFNGLQYPEAVARWVAEQRGLTVYSYEVGLRPFSAFFTSGDATAYPMAIPESFELSEAQNQQLNEYLSNRLRGNFSMAGIKFWPEMTKLDDEFEALSSQFEHVVPIFTNVIFDTSQPHANVLFTDMFEWLDQVLEVIKQHPTTLFIIRAHPDESRPGKASEESVAEWALSRNIGAIKNIKFVGPDEFFSSYEMIKRAKFVMIYNSTIGLESSILGVPVLCAGRARFTQLETVYFPGSRDAYFEQLNRLLNEVKVSFPEIHRTNSRRFLYYQLFRSSLSFEPFLEEDHIWQGYVRLREFPHEDLLPENSKTLHTISEGLLRNGQFLLEAD